MQQTLFKYIERALDNLKKVGRNNYSPSKICLRMMALKETWNQCLQSHAAALNHYPAEKRETLAYFKDDQLQIHEDIYQSTMDYMADCLDELEPSVSPNQSLNGTTTG